MGCSTLQIQPLAQRGGVIVKFIQDDDKNKNLFHLAWLSVLGSLPYRCGGGKC